jgi:hypothetical protein
MWPKQRVCDNHGLEPTMCLAMAFADSGRVLNRARAVHASCLTRRSRAAARSTRTTGGRARLRTRQRMRGGGTRASTATAPSRAQTTSRCDSMASSWSTFLS